MSNGIGGHQSAKMIKDEWLTPPEILRDLGPFDLDPCAPIERPWPMAERHFTVFDNGLKKKWFGKVWCNPPYGKEAATWLSRCADHGNAIALVFARTETKMFFEHVWPKASAVLFIKGRLHFCHLDGRVAKTNSGAPSVLISYGKECAEILRNSSIDGVYIDLKFHYEESA